LQDTSARAAASNPTGRTFAPPPLPGCQEPGVSFHAGRQMSEVNRNPAGEGGRAQCHGRGAGDTMGCSSPTSGRRRRVDGAVGRVAGAPVTGRTRRSPAPRRQGNSPGRRSWTRSSSIPGRRRPAGQGAAASVGDQHRADEGAADEPPSERHRQATLRLCRVAGLTAPCQGSAPTKHAARRRFPPGIAPAASGRQGFARQTDGQAGSTFPALCRFHPRGRAPPAAWWNPVAGTAPPHHRWAMSYSGPGATVGCLGPGRRRPPVAPPRGLQGRGPAPGPPEAARRVLPAGSRIC
jgi:hypothetical protein